MIIKLRQDADVSHVRRQLTRLGLWVDAVEQPVVTASNGAPQGGPILVIGAHSAHAPVNQIAAIDGVEQVCQRVSPHPMVDAHPAEVVWGGVTISSRQPVVIAGPCAVESPEQIDEVAARLARVGVRVLRGGAYKPRTSPYSFQGRGSEGLEWMRAAANRHGLVLVTEAMSERHAEEVAEYADVIQVGSRNMQNYALLKEVGALGQPVLLKRGMASTVEEWLLAAEYLLKHGAASVAFCERGVRSFDEQTRNLLDLGSVALLAHTLGLVVIVDPSHATGRRDLVVPLARAGIAAGASGVMIETHPDPGSALSDGAQALAPEEVRPLCDLVYVADRSPPIDARESETRPMKARGPIPSRL